MVTGAPKRLFRIVSLASAMTLGLAAIMPTSTMAAAYASPQPPASHWITSTNYRYPGNDGKHHAVSWDKYSYMIDDHHLNIWSGEVHYWRLPSPHQWRDVLQKMKAAGFNAVSFYFFWGYHQSAPDSPFDFSGIRNIDLLLRMAAEEGLYVIARPGPYINAEISMGGMPAWQTNSSLPLRNAWDNTNWQQQRAWLHAVNKIIARHQVTNGGGSVLLYQVENEELASVGPYADYVKKIIKAAKEDGINVPIFHNDYAPVGNWAFTTKDTGLDVYSYDDYPIRFDCSATRHKLQDHNWHIDPAFRAAHHSPHFIAEAQGGAFTPWGASFNASACEKFVDANFYRQWAALNNGAGVTAFNYYMIFGGTNWGWTGSAHSGFTSYDYGASLSEDRNLRDKLSAQKENGYFHRAFPQLTVMDGTTDPTVRDVRGAAVKSYLRKAAGLHSLSMSGKGSQYLAFRLADSNDITRTSFTTTLNTFGPGGKAVTFPTVPQEGKLILHGRDALQMPVDFTIGDWGAYYSTGLLFFNSPMKGHPLAVLTGTGGDRGEIVLDAPHKPMVTSTHTNTANTSVTSTWDKEKKQLRINYTWGSPYDITVSMQGKAPLTLRIADRHSLIRAWSPENLLNGTMQGLLVENADLVRSVHYTGHTAHLVGSTTAPQKVRIWLPAGITRATWNGQPLQLTAVNGHYRALLPGPAPVTLPKLTWVKHEENYEANPNFDDSAWRVANIKHPRNFRQGPAFFQHVVLDANAYNFHEGDVWYRAHYTANTDDPRIWIKVFGAEGSNFLVWINGHYLGASAAVKGGVADTGLDDKSSKDPTSNLQAQPKAVTFTVPKGTVKKGEKVTLAILLRNNGQRVDWEGIGNNLHPMGILDARLGEQGNAVWKIQGVRGGIHPADTTRGIYNNGGLYGERAGWYLPGFPDATWKHATTMHANTAGVTWYRTHFTLKYPTNQDVMLRLNVLSKRFSPDRKDNAHTVMFINGWNVGTWVGNVGPQESFTIPSGFLNPTGQNEIAVAVTAEDACYGPEDIQLGLVGNWLGSVPWVENTAPTYRQLQHSLLPAYPLLRVATAK